MWSHGHTTVWGTPIGASRAGSGAGWYQQLRQWWETHKLTRRQAKLAVRDAYWDAQREAVRPMRADAAPEMVAAQHAISTVTMLYGLTI